MAAAELRNAIGGLIKEKGGDIVRDALVKAGAQEAIKAFDNIETAVVDYVTQWVENRIKQTDEKVEHLARIVEDVVKRLEVERRKRLRIEADVLANVVMINGIPMHPLATKENRMETSVETMQRTHEFLGSIKVDTSLCGITEAIRLPQRQVQLNGVMTWTTTIRVTFQSLAHKIALYRALATNGKQSANVRVQDAIPADLMGDKRELEKVASRWRKENTDLRTKVLCRNGEINLYTKDKDDKKYSKVPKETIDLELQPIAEEPRQAPSPAPEPTNSHRGRGYGQGRGAARSGLPRAGKRQRTVTADYDFSRFNAD